MPTQAEISLSPITAKGSILTHDGSSRISIAAGTNGQILTARSSTSSGLAYETSSNPTPVFELIGSSVLTADTASIIFANIDTTNSYASFTLIWQGRHTSTASESMPLQIYVNSVSTSNYYHRGVVGYDTNVSYQDNDGSLFGPAFYIAVPTNASIVANIQVDFFPKNTDMSNRRLHWLTRATVFSSTATTGQGENSYGHGNMSSGESSFLTRLELKNSSGAFEAGTFAYLYGWRK